MKCYNKFKELILDRRRPIGASLQRAGSGSYSILQLLERL
jgi:hypothetical protein